MTRAKKPQPVEQRPLDPDEEAWVRCFVEEAVRQLRDERREVREVGARKGKAA